MAEINAKLVKELRDRTGCGMMECKRALGDAGGDIDKAQDALRAAGAAKAAKKSGRDTSEGWIGHYVHSNGKIGVLLEVMCETDFVAKNDQFQSFIKDLSMHIAAMNPIAVRREEVPNDVVERERAIYVEQVKDKPAEMQDKIVEGKLGKFFAEVCFLDQKFVKDDKKSIQDYINDTIGVVGENISIGRMVRMELGGE